MTRLLNSPRLLIVLLAGLYALVFLTTQADWQFNGGDLPWYLNRARLIWQGELAPNWVYTFAYPFLVGGVFQLTRDAFTSLFIVNTLAIMVLWLGVYALGVRYGNRTIGALAVALVASNYEFYFYARQMQTMTVFGAVMVWLVWAYAQFNTRPSWASAGLLGGLVALALYTRFEGVTYGILIPIAVLQIGIHGQWRTALGYGTVALGVVAPFVLHFLPFIFGTGVTSGAQDIFFVLSSASDPFGYLTSHMAGYLYALVTQWALPLWVVLCWFATRAHAPHRPLLMTFGALATWQLLIIFILIPTEPNPIYFQIAMLWMSLPMAWGLWQLQTVLPRKLWWAVVLAVLLVQMGAALVARTPQAPLSFRQSDSAKHVPTLDTWIQENAPNRPIWTTCPHIILYSQSDLRLVYRFALFFDNPDLPDSPKHLMPIIHERGGLFLDCAIWEYGDWRAVLRDGLTYPPYRLQGLGGVAPYALYEVVRDEE